MGVFWNFDVDGVCLVYGYYIVGNGRKCLKWYIYWKKIEKLEMCLDLLKSNMKCKKKSYC